jgi:hypothetical protein
MAKPQGWATPVSTSNEFFTPKWLLELLGPIAFDPCWSPDSNVAADVVNDVRVFADGLELDWAGAGLCFVNPPYSDCKRWVAKCAAEFAAHGRLIVALIPALPGESYWHDSVWGRAAWALLFRGRLRFDVAGGVSKHGASFGSALVCWGNAEEAAALLEAMRWNAALADSPRSFFVVRADAEVAL